MGKITDGFKSVIVVSGTAVSWIVGLAIAGGLVYLVFLYGLDALWYAAEYSVSPEKVHIAPEPKDCDFWHAPVGFKDCHYEKSVWTHRAGQLGDFRAGEEAPGRKTQYDAVWVSWTKISD